MRAEVSKKIIEKLNIEIKEIDLGTPFFSNSKYTSFPLSKERLHKINDVPLNAKVAYLDGGNHEILCAPNFSVQVNRVYFNIFRGPKRLRHNSLHVPMEFFSVTYSSFRKDNIFFDTSLFPLENKSRSFLPNEGDLSFSSLDKTITSGTHRADVTRVASIARRFAEWTYAKHVVEKVLKQGDILVMDGSLQTAFTNESNYIKRLYEAANEKGVLVTGLSKTSRLFTDTGLSLIGAVVNLAKESGMKTSFYLKIAEVQSYDHNAVIFVVKLHPKAERAFRYEINRVHFLKLDEVEIQEVFSQLSKNAQDIGFPGYPYGLIEADSFSRVRRSEVESFQMLLLSQISNMGKWPKFARHIQAIDAHDFLNMLVG